MKNYYKKRVFRRKTSKAVKMAFRRSNASKKVFDQYRVQNPRGSVGSKYLFGDNFKSAENAQRVARTAARFYGDGDYKDVLRGAAKWGLRGLGAIGGGMTGMGVQQGWDAGAKLSQFAGYGDYGPVTGNQIVAPPSYSSMSDQTPIAMNNTGDLSGDVVISHTEFIQNVTVTSSGAGTSGFQLQAFSINPGLSTVFPFLSQLASNFSLFEFSGLMFQYKPTSGEFGSTNSNSLGKVIMGTNYDPDADAFVSSQQMENYNYANATKPSCGMVHGVETAVGQRFSNQLYTRTGTSLKDKVLTDIGLFQVATEGIYTGAAGSYVIGELWVTYNIKLSRANLNNSALGTAILTDNFTQIQGVGTALVPGATSTKQSTNTLGGVIANISASTFSYTFPPNVNGGTFRVLVYYVSANGSTFIDTANTPANCTLAFPFRSLSSSTGVSLPTLGTSIGTVGLAVDVKVNAPGALLASFRITFGGTFVTNGAQMYVLISEVAGAQDTVLS